MNTRRASAGWVKGSCPGCKKGDTHPKDGICTSCEQLLADARQIVDAHHAQHVEAWFQYARFDHWNPGFYIGCEIDSAARDRLHDAFHAVVLAAATATYEASHDHTRPPHRLKKAPMPLIERAKDLPNDRQAHGDMVLMSYTLAQAVNELDAAMIQALVSVASQEFAHGGDLLGRLAKGTITADTLNETTTRHLAHLKKQEVAAREPVASKRRAGKAND